MVGVKDRGKEGGGVCETVFSYLRHGEQPSKVHMSIVGVGEGNKKGGGACEIVPSHLRLVEQLSSVHPSEVGVGESIFTKLSTSSSNPAVTQD